MKKVIKVRKLNTGDYVTTNVTPAFNIWKGGTGKWLVCSELDGRGHPVATLADGKETVLTAIRNYDEGYQNLLPLALREIEIKFI